MRLTSRIPGNPATDLAGVGFDSIPIGRCNAEGARGEARMLGWAKRRRKSSMAPSLLLSVSNRTDAYYNNCDGDRPGRVVAISTRMDSAGIQVRFTPTEIHLKPRRRWYDRPEEGGVNS